MTGPSTPAELAAAIQELRDQLAWVRDYLDPATLERRIGELNDALADPGVWDDQRRAAKLSSEHARASRKLETYQHLSSEIDDLEALQELFADDPSLVEEASGAAVRARAELDRLREEALFTGEYDAGNAIVTLSAGAGGTDSQDWTEMVLRMYQRWAENRGLKFELLDATPGEEAGLKSATFAVRGENAYGILQAEKGVHRLVRLSPFDSAHRRQTSFAKVELSPEVTDDVEIEIEDKDLRIDTYRAQGAGGQHVNKTDSAVRLTHLPTGIVVQCQNERSQLQNRVAAMRVLKGRLIENEREAREATLARERGESVENSFGSQIRNYVLHPYTMVTDVRTGKKEGNAQGVLDGNLDEFISRYLLARAAGQLRSGGSAAADDDDE
ncbi:MAG: peptide chain release factor 2 [Gaiellales bacterium]